MSSATFAAQREGFSRTDEGVIADRPELFFFAFCLIVIGAILAFSWHNNSDPELRRIGYIAPFAGAVPFAFLVFRSVMVIRKIGRAVLITPYDSVPLGSATNATYVRKLTEGVSVESITARLQCEERVKVRSGKNKNELIEVVRDEELKPVIIPAMGELRVQIPIRIPEDGPPTLWETFAKTRWVVRMKLRMRGCANTNSLFVVEVLPVVVKR